MKVCLYMNCFSAVSNYTLVCLHFELMNLLMISQKACCIVSVKVVNNSSVSVIPIAGLASGSHYQVHVESLSVSGVANSKSKSFKTEHVDDYQRTSHTDVIFAPLIASILIAAILIPAIINRR